MSPHRYPVTFAVGFGAMALGASLALAKPDRAEEVHRDALVIDAHADVYNPLELPGLKDTIDKGSEVDIDKLRQGGVDAIFLSVHAPQMEQTPNGRQMERAIAEAKLSAIKAIAERHPDKAALATTPRQIRRIAASGRTAIMIGLLNGSPYSEEMDAVRHLYDQGIRIIGFVHQGNNQLADSSRPFRRDKPGVNGGLSPIGRQWVADANRFGIVLDVSQLTTQALMQTVALSKAPILASHSGIRALVDNDRNLTDDELAAVAKTGGAVCIVAFSNYLINFPPDFMSKMIPVVSQHGGLGNGYGGMTAEQRMAIYDELKRITPRATVDQYIESITYAVRKIGIDHVCLSTDFNHGVTGLDGWQDESQTQNVTAALVRHGYSARDIRKLWGSNLLRVIARVQSLRDR